MNGSMRTRAIEAHMFAPARSGSISIGWPLCMDPLTL